MRPLSCEASVSSTRLKCTVCDEHLLRIRGTELKDDQVICLICRGHGNYVDVAMGAGLTGQVFTAAQLQQLNQMMAATAREYQLNAL